MTKLESALAEWGDCYKQLWPDLLAAARLDAEDAYRRGVEDAEKLFCDMLLDNIPWSEMRERLLKLKEGNGNGQGPCGTGSENKRSRS